jgi:glucosamine-6-phosphate deaminase
MSRRICVWPDAWAAAEAVAVELTAAMAADPALVLGLATGATMVPVYRRLVRRVRDDRVNVQQVTTFNLDEYVGVPPDAPGSYHAYMRRHLFLPAGFNPARTYLPDGMAADLGQACARYEAEIVEAGGIGIQLLGLGQNGHIGFNEPGTPFDSVTHVVELTDLTRRVNARDFGGRMESVPRQAITMGIGTILRAARILVVVTGAAKAAVISRVLTLPPTEDCPATALHQHPDVTWHLDRAAASRLDASLRGGGRD